MNRKAGLTNCFAYRKHTSLECGIIPFEISRDAKSIYYTNYRVAFGL